MLFLLTEVLVDLTDGPPPQKKIWPEIKDAEDGPPPADAKAKAKAEKEKKKKLIDVSNKLYLQSDFRHFIVVLHLASTQRKARTLREKTEDVWRFFSLGAVPKTYSI